MGLISGNVAVKANFLREWMKYVSAIISYGESSCSKKIVCHLSNLDVAGY